MSITIADLIKVYSATFDARTKWQNILLLLELSSDTVDSIKVEYQNDPDHCYREGLKEWLKGGERSWRDVVKALSSPIVGHGDIARTIERDHVQSTGAAANSTAVQATLPTPLPNPYNQIITENLILFAKEKIGAGAFGVVFKGSYRGRQCAVKVLHQVAMAIQLSIPPDHEQGGASDTFDQECKFLETFRHLNVVQHLSTDKHPMSGSTLLVTELMDCNLRSYLSGLSEESLSSQCEISLSKDIASGLAYIHSKYIIHRDLCGDNILLILSQPLPLAKISDFGMSRLLDSSQLSSTLTTIGHRMGYLPNEALRMDDNKYDYSLDVFSLGVVMVQIVRKKATIKSAKDRSFHVTQIPHTHRLRSLIHSCLQENMRRRPSARHLCASLEEMDTQPAESGDHVIQERGWSTPASGGAAKLGPPPGELRPPLTLKWKRGKDMPIAMGGHVQSVVIDDAMFVGGGRALNSHDNCTVMKLDLRRDQWTTLQYTFKDFALTSINDELLLVGGYDIRTNKPTNRIAVFQSGKWTRSYPMMTTARYFSTAISFNDYIIVAGGWDDHGLISSVEVLDVSARRWYTALSLPKQQSDMKSTLIGNTLYLMGGLDHTGNATKMVHHVDLYELIANALSHQDTPTLWQTIEHTPLKHSVPLSIRRSLLAVGGRDDSYNLSSSIHLYQPDSRRWVKVGDLPTAQYNCTCSVLPSGEVIVAGGMADFSYLNSVHLLSITDDLVL